MARRVQQVAGALIIVCSSTAISARAQQSSGEQQFQRRCASCHSMEPDQNRAGPHLSGIVGRRAGAVEDANYSDALRESGIVWDEEALNSFLSNPRDMVPGSRMTFRVADAEDRQAIVEYLLRK
ncbi:c-type cytochrome [Roseospira marina]|uniref:C-type cytochrome n=2 Tax=Roseospira marina TaxID=140057 RepID=A0A5M6IE45_9PROT|nr:c-type cytochrome [Roseospira marina]